ncbi:hypothetical protein K438DRAFT_2038529 [Mycena galopus ATCC 62051]|nr:hypothetical protein K438DRAFT_2038529 [Mycena galopus ATCC 62051]
MVLVKAQEVLDIETRRTALVPPEMNKDPSWLCTNHSSCLRVWPKVWFDQIGRKLLHPETSIQLKDIGGVGGAVFKEGAFAHSGMFEQCRLDMIVRVSEIRFAHEDIIPACANKIIQYYDRL